MNPSPDFGQGGRIGSREILLYLIMYRRFIRNWLLFKRNRVICPEVAVNGQFLPGKSNIFVKLPEKNRFFLKLSEKFFGEICLENRNFLPGSTTPQISNQIDAAAYTQKQPALYL